MTVLTIRPRLVAYVRSIRTVGTADALAEAEPKGMQEMKLVNVDLYELVRYENGDLDHDETVTLFQALVDSGLVWQLDGPFRPMAEALVAAGLVVAR